MKTVFFFDDVISHIWLDFKETCKLASKRLFLFSVEINMIDH